MRKTRGKYGVLALFALLLLGLLLAAAPAALATATFTEMTATSTWTAAPNPPTVYRVTGGVAHMEFGNTFAVTSSGALGNWFTTTHVYAVAKLVDGLPGDAVIWGTFESVGDAGDTEGTFTGTMSMATGTWSIKGRGKVVSGEMSGALFHVTEVNPGTPTWPITMTMLEPRGS